MTWFAHRNEDGTIASLHRPDEDGASPMPDYASEQLADDNADVLAFFAATYVPVAVTPRQIRLALTQAGLRTSIESYVAASTQDVKDTWEFATTVERTNPIIAAGAAALGMTDAQIDDLFTLAATL